MMPSGWMITGRSRQPRRGLLALLASTTLALGLSGAASGRDAVAAGGGPVCPAPCSAKSWNSVAIDYQAKRIQDPGVIAGDFVQVGTWNAYLRLALLGNQGPVQEGVPRHVRTMLVTVRVGKGLAGEQEPPWLLLARYVVD